MEVHATSPSIDKQRDTTLQFNSQQVVETKPSLSQEQTVSPSIKCEICGGSNIQRQKGIFVCLSCGVQYTAEDLKQMLSNSVADTIKPADRLDSDDLPEDSKEAFQFYLSAAQSGDIRGMLKVADAYCYGRGVEKRPKSGVFWVTEAANRGDSKAQYILARYLMEGFGTEKNLDMAVYWLELSSRQGNIDAQKELDIIKSRVSKYNGTFFLPVDNWQTFYEKHPVENQKYKFRGFEVGDLLEFGSNGNPIPWVITQVEGHRFTLLSLYQTDHMPFNECAKGNESISSPLLLTPGGKKRYAWHNSSLRDWLNEEYPGAFFKGKEEYALLPTVLHFPAYDDVIKDNSESRCIPNMFHASELEDCIDRVFIPEKSNEFYDLCIPRELDGKRSPVLEEIAGEDGDIGNGILFSKDLRDTNWWIRRQLVDEYCEQNLAYSNRMYSNDLSSHSIPDASISGGVRPMITLDIDKAAVVWNEQEIGGSLSYEEFVCKIIEYRKKRELEKNKRLIEKNANKNKENSQGSLESDKKTLKHDEKISNTSLPFSTGGFTYMGEFDDATESFQVQKPNIMNADDELTKYQNKTKCKVSTGKISGVHRICLIGTHDEYYRNISASDSVVKASCEKETILKEIEYVFKTGDFIIERSVRPGMDSSIRRKLREKNDNQVYLRSPLGKEYYCNEFTYYNEFLRDYVAAARKGRVLSPIRSDQYCKQSIKPETYIQDFSYGYGGFQYNLLSCLNSLVKELPENSLIETDENGKSFSNVLYTALDFHQHEANNLYVFCERVYGDDMQKKKMLEELESICEEKNIYIYLGRFYAILRGENLISEYVAELPDGLEEYSRVFSVVATRRYYVKEFKREYLDGHHEIRIEKRPMEMKRDVLLKKEHRTEYGYMKVRDIDYYMYRAEYADGTKGYCFTKIIDMD